MCVPTKRWGWRRPPSAGGQSERSYDPQPPRWEYPTGAQVRKVDSWGKLHAWHKTWNISKALCGEWVQLERIGSRVLVYYCRTLIRELNLENQRSTSVERWFSSSEEQTNL